MLITLSLIAAAACNIEIQGGKCTPVPAMPNFELGEYAGLWYEQIAYPFRFPFNTKCTTATYTGINATAVTVNNTVIKPDENGLYYYEEVIGSAVQTEPESSGNKLYVNFPKPPGACLPGGSCNDIGVQEANYIVLDTDYKNYTFDFGNYTNEMFWILSRSQDFHKTEMYEEVVQRAVEKFGFRRELAYETPQEDCEYDYLKDESPPNNALFHALSLQLLILCYFSTKF